MAKPERKLEADADLGNSARAHRARREADHRASMSRRLARLHVLCMQMNAIKGAASR